MKRLASITAAVLIVGANALSSIAAESIPSANDNTFRTDVLASSTPVVVDFYAEWCGPCRRMGPVFDNLSKKYRGKVKFVRVNIDESPRTAGTYGISSIPAFAVFRGGHLVDGVIGAVPEQQLNSIIGKAAGTNVRVGAAATPPQPQ